MLFTKTENTEIWQDLVVKRAFISGCMTGIAFMLGTLLLVNFFIG